MYIWYVYSIIQEKLQTIINKKELELVGKSINNRPVFSAKINPERVLTFQRI